jgi:hypothetical protein
MIVLAAIAAIVVGLFVFGLIMQLGRILFPRAGILGLIIMLAAIGLGLNAGAAVYEWIA